jgi:hypothetical protein
MDRTNINGFIADLNVLNNSSFADVAYGQTERSRNPANSANIKIVMYMRFMLSQNYIFIKYFNQSYLKTVPISIINDIYKNDTIQSIAQIQLVFLINLFSAADIFEIQTVPGLWLGGNGVTVKTLVENYEAQGKDETYIFSQLYPYIPLELLLAHRTYYNDLAVGETQSGQQTTGEGKAKPGIS